MPGPDFDLARSPSHLLHRAQQVAADAFSKSKPPSRISLRQFIVLAAIAEHEGASQNTLVRTTGVDRSTLADIIKRLEREGFVAKPRAQDDSRANAISLTPRGAAALDGASSHALDADAAVLNALPKGKRKAFSELLIKLGKALDVAAEKAEKKERKRDQKEREARDRRRKKERVATRKKAKAEKMRTAVPG